MSTNLRALITQRIRSEGPLTVAAFMDMALYHPSLGYYTRAPRKTGREGDFFTSVDVGPQFGSLLAIQLAEMHRLLAATGEHGFELVEIGAGNGQLARDILDAASSDHAEFYASTRLTLVETSPAARDVQRTTLGQHAKHLVAQSPTPPQEISGVILANELLDALPTHVVTMTSNGLAEIFVGLDDNQLVERLAAPSTERLAHYLDHVNVQPAVGWRGEVNLAAVDWIRDVTQRLTRGFLLLIDYGHSADKLYAGHHASGTLTTFRQHLINTTTADPQQPGGPAWLAHPGEQDITAHVDLTSVKNTALHAGLDLLGEVDQTRFLLGLGALDTPLSGHDTRAGLRHRLALKSLLVPGGLGTSHTVMLFGKGVGRPALRGASFDPTSAAESARADLSPPATGKLRPGQVH
jgi:SAM-dependent MidA family methyltransferase